MISSSGLLRSSKYLIGYAVLRLKSKTASISESVEATTAKLIFYGKSITISYVLIFKILFSSMDIIV